MVDCTEQQESIVSGAIGKNFFEGLIAFRQQIKTDGRSSWKRSRPFFLLRLYMDYHPTNSMPTKRRNAWRRPAEPALGPTECRVTLRKGFGRFLDLRIWCCHAPTPHDYQFEPFHDSRHPSRKGGAPGMEEKIPSLEEFERRRWKGAAPSTNCIPETGPTRPLGLTPGTGSRVSLASQAAAKGVQFLSTRLARNPAGDRAI